VTTLERYAEINPPFGNIEPLGGDRVAFVPMAAVSEDGRLERHETRPLAEVAKGYTAFARGDVLMAKITPCMENGKAALVSCLSTEVGFGSTEFHVLRPRPGVDGRFLFYLVWNHRFREQAAKHMTGSAGQKRVPAAYLRQAKVPLVDPKEQRRIADTLDKAAAIYRKRREGIALTEALLRSSFLEIFGDPVANSKAWPRSTVGDELDVLEYGPRFYNERYSADGVRIVRITDLDVGGRLDFAAMPRMAVDSHDKERYALRPGDVIFARSGATVGKTALVRAEDPECIAGAYFIRLRFKSRISAIFAREVLASESIQRIIAARSRQSAQQNFSGPGIRELPLPVPPRSLQERFEQLTEARRPVLAGIRKAAAESGALFNALLSAAYAGTLSRQGSTQ
jgi:type I restriction enzyme, S subunit